MPDQESRSAYIAARKAGRKYLSEHGDADGYLAVLDDILKGLVIVGELNLGYHEIPLDSLAGTKTAARSNAFAGNFMPLLENDTEFAVKWQKVYSSQLQEGIREPVIVYQFLNKFYVQEGNKRVSILKAVGAASASAVLTRLIPERDEDDDDISIYYEFLDYDKRMFFDDLWFTKRGNFTALANYAESCIEANPDIQADAGELINRVQRTFRAVYKTAVTENINLTTGDALVEYIKVFGFPYNVTVEDLRRNLLNFKGQLLVAAGDIERNTLEVSDAAQPSGSRPGLFSRAPSKLIIAVAYFGTPNTNLWTAQHNLAIKRIERKYGDRLIVKRVMNLPPVGELAYRALSEIAEVKPHILFTTSPSMSTLSLRYALEHSETLVLNCDSPHEGKNLHTYFCKMYDLTFLCGILSAAMSETGTIGYMSAARSWDFSTYDVNAFALGARLINPRSEVLNYTMRGINDWAEHDLARAEFAANGADIAFCQHSPDNPLDRKAFPEVYAQLYRLAPNGAPLESLAGATLDWEPFYDKMIGDALLGRMNLSDVTQAGSPVHFGWGFQTGIMDIFPVYSVVGVAGRLLRIFRDLLKSGGLHPFEGPINDNEGNLRIEGGVTPTLMEIQEMDWLAYSVRQLNSEKENQKMLDK
ncbi:MAG: BMP family ABC transporter substrate-binding protein [Oscillospiraceae bacterium]|jgi:hypothetical protein|nr:BMP family ABC transporter substrate-binding protein [Oscillospiraceae bacterium]